MAADIQSVNPQFAAKHIAGLLDADPVMARLVKEHLAPTRLREVLELPDPEPVEPETLEDAFFDTDKDGIRDLVTAWLEKNPPK